MAPIRSWRGAPYLGLVVAAIVAGCGAGSGNAAPSESDARADSPAIQRSSQPSAQAPSPSPSGLAGASLVLLGNGPDGSTGLWTLTAPDSWTFATAAPGATAVARFGSRMAVAQSGGVTLLDTATLTAAATPRHLSLSLEASGSPILAIAESPSGNVAVVTGSVELPAYWLVDSAGTVKPLAPAPSQALSPQVAWLDDERLLVLTRDSAQTSRLAVVDVAARTIAVSNAAAGVRVFAVSVDRSYMAFATDGEVYAGLVADFLGSGKATGVAKIPDGSVVWALALDDAGGRLALLSGVVAADGNVGGVREQGYGRADAAWSRLFDAAVSIEGAIGQVWAP